MNKTAALVFLILFTVFGSEIRASEYEDARDSIPTPLYSACVKGDIDLVLSLLKNGADVNERNRTVDAKYKGIFVSEAETPLFTAIRTRNARLVGILLDNGAAVNIAAPLSGTPLLIAVEIAHLEITGMILDRGADVNALVPCSGLRASDGKCAPLHVIAADTSENVAVRKRIVKMLIGKGADVNVRESMYGQTPLHLAVKYGQFEMMESLVEGGADVNARETGENGDATPL